MQLSSRECGFPRDCREARSWAREHRIMREPRSLSAPSVLSYWSPLQQPRARELPPILPVSLSLLSLPLFSHLCIPFFPIFLLGTISLGQRYFQLPSLKETYNKPGRGRTRKRRREQRIFSAPNRRPHKNRRPALWTRKAKKSLSARKSNNSSTKIDDINRLDAED